MYFRNNKGQTKSIRCVIQFYGILYLLFDCGALPLPLTMPLIEQLIDKHGYKICQRPAASCFDRRRSMLPIRVQSSAPPRAFHTPELFFVLRPRVRLEHAVNTSNGHRGHGRYQLVTRRDCLASRLFPSAFAARRSRDARSA